jgi:hypothetical protein
MVTAQSQEACASTDSFRVAGPKTPNKAPVINITTRLHFGSFCAQCIRWHRELGSVARVDHTIVEFHASRDDGRMMEVVVLSGDATRPQQLDVASLSVCERG